MKLKLVRVSEYKDAMLVAALKELNAKVEALQSRIAALEAK